ncbi:MAG: tyrosine-protein phosphatase [Acidimicrobiales bacterium]|nr:tyrosine-protein phosphatase [Acidimicrobiales bacterium]MYB81030.1 tyrosine-protein phosphatase [Acidimicrobiales bacterium]MYI12333.1 tyrosine-protein phosphatase [Acidimicrobiales bacterium]MYI29732.1 tyrosine-protein phosphatase [Acidimicrobiales bacterium]
MPRDARQDAVVTLEGARNCRDLGGYPAEGGRHVRMGALFRSDRLSTLTIDDLDELGSRGIRTVVDFRAGPEVERDRSRLWPGVTAHISLPVGDTVDGDISMVDQIFEGRLRSVSEDDMAGLYLQMIGQYGERFAQLVALAADVDQLPMLFHCTAGKDRSGIASALLLEALGVDRETVLDDYCLSNELRSHQRIAELTPEFAKIGIDIDEVRAILSAPRAVMASVLGELDSQYGSRQSNGAGAGAQGYLLAHGLDPAALEMLQANLLI